MIPQEWLIAIASLAFTVAGASIGFCFRLNTLVTQVATKLEERTGVIKNVAEITVEHAATLVNHSSVIEELRGLVRALGSVPVAIAQLQTMITGESNRLSTLMEAIARQKP